MEVVGLSWRKPIFPYAELVRNTRETWLRTCLGRSTTAQLGFLLDGAAD